MKLYVNGNRELNGIIKVSGAKNSALPILASTILFEEKPKIENLPDVIDVKRMIAYLKGKSEGTRYNINTLGMNLVKFGESFVTYGSGCKIGDRSNHSHFFGLQKLGASITETPSGIAAKGKLHPAKFSLPYPSVSATEHLISTASVLVGKTVIRNVALEPEVQDLIAFLNKSGAKIFLDKERRTVTINGSGLELFLKSYRIMFDRIEAGTWLILNMITNGEVKVQNIPREYMPNLFVSNVETGSFPEFPTDLQPMMTVMFIVDGGFHTIIDKVFPQRFFHVKELKRMGAEIYFLKKGMIVIDCAGRLEPNHTVEAHDIRCGASLVLAGLTIDGQTIIKNTQSIFRGYENFVKKLRKVGADVRLEVD